MSQRFFFHFQDPDYSQELDSYLYGQVGYSLLDLLSSSIFYSPYAITSLREYFANGFEAFFYYKDTSFLRRACPELYKKLYNLLENESNFKK